MKFKIEIKLQGSGGSMWTAPKEETIEAENLLDALKRLSVSEFPDNDMLKTVGIRLEEVDDS